MHKIMIIYAWAEPYVISYRVEPPFRFFFSCEYYKAKSSFVGGGGGGGSEAYVYDTKTDIPFMTLALFLICIIKVKNETAC